MSLLAGLSSLSTAGPDFLGAMRREATARLLEEGLPHRKVEGWRFTPVSRVTRVPFEEAAPSGFAKAAAFAREHHLDDDALQILVADGRPSLDPLPALPPGVQVHSLAALLASGDAGLEAQLGKVARAEHFAALNAARFADGLVLRVAQGAHIERPIEILHVGVAASSPAVAHPRLLLLPGEGCDLRVVETYVAMPGHRHLTNAVTEVVLGAGARVSHIRVVRGAEHETHLGTVAVVQGAASAYRSHVVTLGGALSRVDLCVRFAGEGAECELEGVYHATGDEHVDHRTLVDHAVPGCRSREAYRGIVGGHARAVFDGTMIVRRDAQGSSVQQENRNLLLSDDAVVNTKPHLEIDANDVMASHGATVGAIDDSQLFYLRARGIDEGHARDMLTFAFVDSLLGRIPHASLARRLGGALLDRLPHGRSVREMLP